MTKLSLNIFTSERLYASYTKYGRIYKYQLAQSRFQVPNALRLEAFAVTVLGEASDPRSLGYLFYRLVTAAWSLPELSI